MATIYRSAAEHLQNGTAVILVTVISSAGSVPRTAGTQMIVLPDGSMEGTVGGGAAENGALQTALTLMDRKNSAVRGFSTAQEDGAGDQDAGTMRMHFLYLDPDSIRDRVLMEETDAKCASRGRDWLVFRFRDDGSTETALSDGYAVSMSRTILSGDIRPYLWNRPVFSKGDPGWFVMPLQKQKTAFLFGCGHVAKKLGDILNLMDRRVTVIDDRGELCNAERFPYAECIPLPPEKAFSGLTVCEQDEIVALSRDPETDGAVMEWALRTDARYIGCIGSRRKIGRIRERLLKAGFPEDQISRIHMPVGLPIGAETPAEIAVSVAAEMIRHGAEQDGI
ncbi:MAG: XdhC family protein [Clostridia bacterium]|nr:XdhC family protein [Clostridia bacterium]